jgi:hypothetical protein
MKLEVGQIWFTRHKVRVPFWKKNYSGEYSRTRIVYLTNKTVGLLSIDRDMFGGMHNEVVYSELKSIEFHEQDLREIPNGGEDFEQIEARVAAVAIDD